MDAVVTPEHLLANLIALADPVRLRLLATLEHAELGVGELADVVALPQSSVSRHLKALADRGLVTSRSVGASNRYRVADHLDPAASRLWEISRAEITSWPALREDRARLDHHLEARARRRSVFASVAADWDELRSELYGDRFTDMALHALLPASWTVADLGCGTGLASLQLASCVARVIAVDESPEMLRAAARRLEGLGNVDLRRGDLGCLPIADSTCDAAVCMLALTHTEEPLAAIQEAARILRPGGRLVVVDLLQHDRIDFQREMGQLRPGFTPAELAGLLEAGGLTGVRSGPLPHTPNARGPALLLADGSLPEPAIQPKG